MASKMIVKIWTLMLAEKKKSHTYHPYIVSTNEKGGNHIFMKMQIIRIANPF